jgi:hypothetical protein
MSLSYLRDDCHKQAVTHIGELRWFESMYTLQGKTRSTCHVRFPCQSTYAQRTLPAGSPHTWQPFTSHRQSWAGPLLPRKRAPDTIQRVGWQIYGFVPSFSHEPTNKVVGVKPSIYQRPATRLTGPISPACDRYVQYLLAGANPSVLNRHRHGLQPWRCRLGTYHSPTLPTSCLHFPPKRPVRSPV